MKKGYFFVLDGIDGSGTTTHACILVDHLNKIGIPAVYTNEPSGGPIGKHIRNLLINTDEKCDWITMALLFAADRTDHLEREVMPLLDKGVTVICDRYVLSSLAYQTETAPNKYAEISWIKMINTKAISPDMTFILDVSAAEAARRRLARGGKPERFDHEDLQSRLVKAYRKFPSLMNDEKIIKIHGERPKDEVSSDLQQIIKTFMEENRPMYSMR